MDRHDDEHHVAQVTVEELRLRVDIAHRVLRRGQRARDAQRELTEEGVGKFGEGARRA